MSASAVLGGMGAAALAALLAIAALDLDSGSAGLALTVAQHMDQSGVAHPVTGVLLNFRGYDTWLELVVLLVAALGALHGDFRPRPPASALAGDPVLSALLIVLAPAAVFVAGYLLERGAYAPGGAFQAGATLAAAIVMLHLAGRITLGRIPARALPWLLVAGVLAFALAAVAGLLLAGALLSYVPAHAGAVILGLETAATVSIALTLAALACAPMDGGASAQAEGAEP